MRLSTITRLLGIAYFYAMALLGLCLFGWALFTWADVGFPLSPRAFSKNPGPDDGPFFLVVLGALVFAYAAYEIIKRQKLK